MMYQVIRDGLTNVNPSAMLEVFGVQVVPLTCNNINPATGQPDAALGPCINTIIPFLNTSIDVSQPSTIFSIPIASFVLGISILAVVSAGLQLVQSRMMLPQTRPEDDDPNTKIQRQTMLFLPLISVAYGGFLPAGLFIYWITATIFSIIQQYLIVGLGRHVPAVRPNARVRDGAHPPLPGVDATTTSPREACGHPDRRRQEDHGRQDDPPPRAGPSGPTRETTLK